MDVDESAISATWDVVEGTKHHARGAFVLLKPQLGPEKLPTVLGFGCGTGLQTAKLRSVAQRIVAVDTSREMIEQFRSEFPDVESRAADVGDLVSTLVFRRRCSEK